MSVKYNNIIQINDLNMDRLFGKELSNVAQINGHNRVKLIGRIHSQSTRASTSEDATRVLLKRFNRSSANQTQIQKIQKQQPCGKKEVQEKLEKLEKKEVKDTQMIEEYFDDCFKYMMRQEEKNYKLSNYIPQQSQINEKMRGILLDWLIQLHLKFKMFTNTLYITVMIIDLYLAQKNASKQNLQLIGAAALYIAAKYEQTYQVPQMEDLVHFSAKAFTKQQIIAMEADIIEALQFKLVLQTSYKFFEPLVKICKMELKNMHLAQYVLQLSLLQTKFLQYKPSHLASSSIYLINKIRKRSQPWPSELQSLTGYTEKELKNCARELCHLLERADQLSNTKSLKKKFSLTQYNQVTRIKLERKKH